jgi:NodT family efflux transporter outer membrane factor (OMF) lipoprotein
MLTYLRNRNLPVNVRGGRIDLRRLIPGRHGGRKAVLLLAFLVLLGSGCASVGPNYVRPEAPEPREWLEGEDPRINVEPVEYRDWWTVFDDPVLTDLVETAYRQNLDLRIAGIRVLEARAELGIAVGNRYPQLQQFRGDYTYINLSDNAANTFALDGDYGDYSVGFDAAWELDFWGKFRRAVEFGIGNLEASIASYDDFLVTLTAEVARTYVLIRTLEERLKIARENVGIQERSLRIARARFDGGETTELDVQQAISLLNDTRSLVPRLESSLRQAKNGLSILLGTLPGEIDGMLAKSGPIPAVPVEVAVGIPADLLRRRPDIQLAERRVASQSALIGVAKADLYPHFTVVGSLGLRSSDSNLTKAGGIGGSDASDLFDSDSIEFFGGPGFRWDIFNYGRIKNRVRIQDARFQQLVVNYQNSILNAAREVEDATVGFLRGQEEVKFLSDSVQASRRSVDLSLVQYREGLVSFQRVLDTQRFLTLQQDFLAATSGSVAISLIGIYKALGGGWQIRMGKDFVPEEIKEDMRKRTNWGDLLSREEVEEPTSDEGRDGWRWPDW